MNNHNLSLKLFIAALVCLGVFLSFYYRFNPGGDYANYYFGSKFLIKGIPIDKIYDPASFNVLISDEGINKVFINYAPVPPFSLLFFIPFTVVDFYTSKVLFNLISVFIFCFSLYRFLEFVNFQNKFLPFLFLIIIMPVRNNIILGQSYLLLIFFLMEGYILSENKKQFSSSFLFAIPIVLKIFPAIIFIWLFITGRIKELWLTIIFCGILFLCVVPFTGFMHVWSYCTSTFPRLSAGEFNDPFSVTYQTITVLLRRLFVYDGMMNTHVWISSPLLFNVLNTLVIGFIFTAGIYVLRQYMQNTLFTFGFVVFLGLLISGYGTSYSLILLTIPAVDLLKENESLSLKITYAVLLILITVFPVHLFLKTSFPFQYIRLWLLLIVFTIMLSKRKLKISLWNYCIIIALLSIPVIFRYMKKEDESSYYLNSEPSALLLDFNIHQDKLMVYYFNDNGKDSTLYSTNFKVNKIEELPIINNQVLYQHTPLTFGGDLKKKAMLINGEELLYLSDKGKGVGLYSLRKLIINK